MWTAPTRVQLSSLKVHTDLYVEVWTLWASSCFHDAVYRGIIVTWYHCMETSGGGAIFTSYWPRVLSQARCASGCTTCVYSGHTVIWSVGLISYHEAVHEGTHTHTHTHTHIYIHRTYPHDFAPLLYILPHGVDDVTAHVLSFSALLTHPNQTHPDRAKSEVRRGEK